MAGTTGVVDLGSARVDVTSGAVNAQTNSSSVWSYGNWQNTLYLDGSATGGAQADNTVIYTSNDISVYNYHLIENTSATDPVDVYITVDGTNYLATAAAVKLHDATASATHVVTIPAGDVGILEGKFRGFRVLKDGATAETPSIRYAHSVK